MDARDPALNISPLDNRYWNANPVLFEALSDTLSEKAVVRYLVRAESALIRAHAAGNPALATKPELLEQVETLEDAVTPGQVAEEENKTRHDIRALVNVIQSHLPPELAPWVHLGATSMDIVDTATAMRVRDAMHGTVIPLVLDLLDALVSIAKNEARTPQVGRTHGQFAVPITFGFAMAEYISRLGQSAGELVMRSKNLRGKLSGAVGAYNATSLLTEDPEALEARFLELLGLERADYSSQVVEPEHLLRLLLEMNVAFGIVANLADDLRHLQRSEIAELAESFGQDQVGSSTMPQKRNPWNSEHVKSLWKAFAPRVMSFYMDQISEHQRDLSNSASGRFVADYIAGFAAAVSRMTRVVRGLSLNRQAMESNLQSLGDSVLAEPAYILLALTGRADAHELVRQATIEARSAGLSLREVLERSDAWPLLEDRLRRLGMDARTFFDNPADYRGLSVERTENLVKKYTSVSETLRKHVQG